MAVARPFGEMLWQNRNKGHFVDFKLHCNGEVIDVHRIILCSHSSVFSAALLSSCAEPQQGFYEIKDSPPSVVSKMVEFMYMGSYNAGLQEPATSKDANLALVFHAHMMMLADKYLISSLRDEAQKQFVWSLKFGAGLPSMIRSVPEVYAIDAEGTLRLHQALLEMIAVRIDGVGPSLNLYAALADVGKICPSFTTNLLKLVIARNHYWRAKRR